MTENVIYTSWNDEKGMTNYDVMMEDAFDNLKGNIISTEEAKRREIAKLRNDGSNYTKKKKRRK